MSRVARYRLIYDEAVIDHLRAIARKYHSMIRDHIELSLLHEPEVETRNRKPLARLPVLGSVWELRFGPNNRFRVFFRTEAEAREVHVLATGEKEGNRLRVAGKEFKL
jgi:hypothetical protein